MAEGLFCAKGVVSGMTSQLRLLMALAAQTTLVADSALQAQRRGEDWMRRAHDRSQQQVEFCKQGEEEMKADGDRTSAAIEDIRRQV
jgi:hypothetical protein